MQKLYGIINIHQIKSMGSITSDILEMPSSVTEALSWCNILSWGTYTEIENLY